MTLLEVEHLFLRSLSEWMTVTTVLFFFFSGINNENFIDTKNSYPGIKDVYKWVQYNQSHNYNDQSNHKLNIKKNNPTIDIQSNEFFFFIGNEKFY